MPYNLIKYRSALCFLLALCGLTFTAHGQSNRAAAPKFEERMSGRAKLAGGIYWPGEETHAQGAELSRFLREQGIPVNNGPAKRKNIELEMRQSTSMRQIPPGTHNAWSLVITPRRITIDYQSPQGRALAVRQLTELIGAQSRTQGVSRKNLTLPCAAFRGWMTDQEMIAFRWQDPQTVVPLGTTRLEMVLTDSLRGWLGAADILAAVGYGEPLHTTHTAFTYADVEQKRREFVRDGIQVLPVFELTGKNERFEQITGHPMLSVEGMWFIQMLLDSFFNHCGSDTVAFVVPEGRYREQLRRLVERYPQITALRFLDE